MKIVRTSSFKNPETDIAWFNGWVARLEKLTNRTYQPLEINTSLGKTLVWTLGQENAAHTLLIFPGFRTSPLFWDLDCGLDYLLRHNKIYLVETNGQPNPSDGNSPAIKSSGYGHWACEVMDQLGLEKTFISGASFGGLVCMKLALAAPERVHAAFLLNPGCLQPFSLKWKNLRANLLPVLFPSEKNILKFLNAAVFCKSNHQLNATAETLIVEFERMALTRYKDKTQKPYYMREELNRVAVPTYLLEGDNDTLFPYKKSIANAQRHIRTLKDTFVFNQVGHGIETYRPALEKMSELILAHQ
ncbi:MAG: alpha/beta hydrolase [Bacteroidetes bacterium]|nr:alpha/beta hydrolase [Bacteroidota bacterium]